LGITYLNENLPSLSFGWCHGPNTFVEGVLDIIQLHDPGHHLSGLWKGLIGWHHLRFTFTQVGQWILNGGPHSRKWSQPTLGNPSLVHDQGLRKVLDVIGEDPQWISSLPMMDILLKRECQQPTTWQSPHQLTKYNSPTVFQLMTVKRFPGTRLGWVEL